jgi:hypothetical protein
MITMLGRSSATATGNDNKLNPIKTAIRNIVFSFSVVAEKSV